MCRPEETKSEVMSRHLRRATTYGAISVALLALSTTLTIPHLQSRRDSLECNVMCYGSLTSARSALSLVGAAMMGRLSDSSTPNSRKMCLIVGSVATLVGMMIAANTFSIQGLWWSMIPGALFQQNFNILKALLSDLQDEGISPSERAGAVGKLGMAAGLAFMLGPLAGATILKTFELANAAGMLCVLASIAIDLTLPNPSRISPPKTDPKGFLDFLSIKAARSPGAILLMSIRTAMALAFHVFQTIWSVALKTRFDFGPAEYGKFMSFIGLAYALSQGFLAKFLLETLGGNKSDKVRVRMILACCFTLGVGRYVAFQTHSLAVVYVLFASIVTALGMVNTILAADTSYLASSDQIGLLFGLIASAESGAGMIGPALGGALSYIHPDRAPLFCVVGLYVAVFVLVAWGYERFILKRSKQDSGKVE